MNALAVVVLVLSGPASGDEQAREKDTLTVRVTAAKARVLVGEPLVLWIEYAGSASGYFQCDPARRYERVWISAGSDPFRVHHPARLVAELREDAYRALRNGRERCTTVLVYDGHQQEWALPRPGSYRLFFEYSDHQSGYARSNVVTIVAKEPREEERRMRDGIGWQHQDTARSSMFLLGEYMAPFVGRRPRSPYVQMLRLADLRLRILHIGIKRSRTEQETADFIAIARDLADERSPFSPGALLTLADLEEDRGNTAGARAALGEVMKGYPLSPEADRGREKVADLDERAREANR